MNIFGFGRKRPLVMVVDDDPAVGELHCDLLESLDCDRVLKTDAKDALKAAAESKPDLILLDMVMPSMNGLSVLRFLKQESATSKIPVMMLTGESRVSDVESAFALGAADYIVKPAVRRDLYEKVKKLLGPKGYSFPE